MSRNDIDKTEIYVFMVLYINAPHWLVQVHQINLYKLQLDC